MAGNWKMNKTRDEALQFIYAVADNLPSIDKLDSIVCAPAIVLRDLVKRQGENLRIGAQNMNENDSGAYTGEISPVMLTSTNVTYVIIGHSERRQYYNETDEKVNAKTIKALSVGLLPIVCVGETLEQREKNETLDVLKHQVEAALANIGANDVSKVIIAYEPIWAIGTGKSASVEIAENCCKTVRDTVRELFGDQAADEVRIQYGGSVKPNNVEEYMAQPDIDGALIGGASLKEDSFIEIIEKTK